MTPAWTAPTVIAAAAPAWPKIDGPTTSPPAELGYSVAVTPPPFWSMISFSRGIAAGSASTLQSTPKQRLIASCTSVAGPAFSQMNHSTGFWEPRIEVVFRAADQFGPFEQRFPGRVEQVDVDVGFDPFPGFGPLHVEGQRLVFVDGDPEGVVFVGSAGPGSKSRQWSREQRRALSSSGGQAAVSRNFGVSQEAMSTPPPSIRLSLPAAVK